MFGQVAIFYRDALRRSAWGDHKALLLHAITCSNTRLLRGFAS